MRQAVYSEEPLTLLECWGGVHRHYGKLLCPDSHTAFCKCVEIQTHYGTRIHKCSRLLCTFSRVGFTSETERDRHTAFHLRSFKCDFADYEFSKIGFLTKAQLKTHTSLTHMEPAEPRIASTIVTDEDTDEHAIYQAMVDAVEMGEVGCLKPLLAAVVDPPLDMLLHISYLCGARPSVLDLLESLGACLDHRPTLRKISLRFTKGKSEEKNRYLPDIDINEHIWTAVKRLHVEKNIETGAFMQQASSGPQTALTTAIEGRSIEVVDWLISRGVRVDEQIMVGHKAITPLDYMLERHQKFRGRLPVQMMLFLLDHDATFSKESALQCLISSQSGKWEESAYVDVAGNLIQRGAIVKIDALMYLVNGNFSCEMGRLLIENGADMNDFLSKVGKHEWTALLRSLGSNTKKAAEFARFLLESGAKTTVQESDLKALKDIKMKPTDFARWAGMGWDELCAINGSHAT